MASSNTDRYDHQRLISWASEIFKSAGMEEGKARITAEILAEGDLLGHTTHGLQLFPAYLESLEKGLMLGHGMPDTINDQGAVMSWDGKYLPGPWLTSKAISLALDRIKDHPVVTITIQKSHHIGCLAAYPKRATDNNLVMILGCSDPSIKIVAPFGGVEALYTPNPIAAGFPTSQDPIIFDISMSAVANGTVAKAYRQQEKLGGQWVQDADGNAGNDPAVLFSDDPGTILPLGGTDLGYKGFALGIMVEALTSALGGHGRSDHTTKWGASVFLQLIDPDAFGGKEFFKKEMGWFSQRCRTNPAKTDSKPVRLPGQKALQLRTQQLNEGVILDDHLVETLKECGEKTGANFPLPLP